MLDYTFHAKNKEPFVKYYEVKDGKMIIYTDKKKVVTDYSKTLEISVLDCMKNQMKQWHHNATSRYNGANYLVPYVYIPLV